MKNVSPPRPGNYADSSVESIYYADALPCVKHGIRNHAQDTVIHVETTKV